MNDNRNWPSLHCKYGQFDSVLMDTEAGQLRDAVESQLGGTATFVEAVSVKEKFLDEVVWEGVVHVFDLSGQINATRAYAWSAPIEGSTKHRYFAVLHLGGIRSPQDAVRAAIVQEHRHDTNTRNS